MRIEQYFQQTLEAQNVSDPEFESLLSGKIDSTTAARVWLAIADGSASVDQTLRWAQHVARQVDARVIKSKASDAAPAALQAIGFYGPIDRHRAARECLDIIASFPMYGEDHEPLPAKKMPASMWLKLMRKAGHLVDLNDKTALNRINEWRIELGIDSKFSDDVDDPNNGSGTS